MSTETPLSVLRRLSAEQATGELICAARDLEVHVYLQQGRVAWATSSAARLAFARELVRRSGIDATTLQELVDDCRRNRRPLGETLVSWNLASLEDVRESLRLQVRDALATLSGRRGAPTLFLERGAPFLAYDRALTFELDELLDGPMSEPPGPPAAETPVAVLDKLLRDVPDIRWAALLRRGEVLASRPSSRAPRPITHTLAQLAFGDEVDVAVLRNDGGATIGVAREDDASLWLGLGADARLGGVFAALGDLLPLVRASDAPRQPDVVVSGPGCSSCEAVLRDVLERWVDADAACVLHEGTSLVVSRRSVDVESFRAIAESRAPMLFVVDEPDAGATSARTTPAARPARSIALGRRDSWLLATPVAEDSSAVLWLEVSRQASQGLAWALLSATARQVASVPRDGGAHA